MKKIKYYWTDIESGITFECSKQYVQSMKENYKSAYPKIIKGCIRTPILIGTKTFIATLDKQLK
jgi:hypothetical protein